MDNDPAVLLAVMLGDLDARQRHLLVVVVQGRRRHFLPLTFSLSFAFHTAAEALSPSLLLSRPIRSDQAKNQPNARLLCCSGGSVRSNSIGSNWDGDHETEDISTNQTKWGI